jgi:hypothetical protein
MTEPHIDSRQIQLLGIVHAAKPLAELPSSRRLRASDPRGQLLIATDPTTVFWRTSAGAAQADRKQKISRKRHYAFDREVVEPVVTEVVGVLKPAALDEGQLVKGESPRIWDGWVPVIGVRILVPRTADLKLIQVVILPRHRRLQNAMQSMERARSRNCEPSPDGWLDLGQLHVEKIEAGGDGGPPARRSSGIHSLNELRWRCLRLAHQPPAVMLVPAQVYIPLRPKGMTRPSGARDTSGPSAACAG